MSQSFHVPRWWWLAGFVLGLALVAVICVLLNTNNNRTNVETSSVTSESLASELAVTPSVLPTITPAVSVAEITPKLPYIDFPPGSIEEVCGLNDFPQHWVASENLESIDHPNALESAACWNALADHINAIDPYLFLWGEELYQKRPIAFVVLDDPLTFERIFADPIGDLIRVQDALSRSECLLTGDETNWELKESCHAEAFLNYALINRFCFDAGRVARKKKLYWWEDNPTPEQDRIMWKQDLEDEWIRAKCKELSPTLELTERQHPELYDLLLSMRGQEGSINVKLAHASLIELAARLGDDTAGLTQPLAGVTGVSSSGTYEQGYKYGRYSWLLTSSEWREFAQNDPPTVDRFLRTFNMLAKASARRPNPRDEIEFDWKWVAHHLCKPPYYSHFSDPVPEEPPEHSSCKEIVHEIRQRDIRFPPLLDVLDKFEQVAVESEVYD